MPATYRIDTNAEIVFSTASGVVTDTEILAHQDSLRVDPNFRPHFRQLLDFRAVTKVDATPATVRQLAENNPFGQGARRAAVVERAVVFQDIRTFLRFNRNPDEFQIFFNMDSARKWLALDMGGSVSISTSGLSDCNS
jgi:hypothetical protein